MWSNNYLHEQKDFHDQFKQSPTNRTFFRN